MVQMITGQESAKSTAEFDSKGFRGAPYAMIFGSWALKKYRIYLLDTKENLYYPLAEWDEGDSENWNKWYNYVLSVNKKIGKIRDGIKEQGGNWSDMDKIEQIVPDDIKMIKDLKEDDWSLL